jgi:hemolysin activation/secretion protein
MSMRFTRLALIISFATLYVCKALAAGTDAGTLEQSLKKQIENEQKEVPSESVIKKKEPTPATPKDNQILIDVKKFKVTGMTVINEEEAAIVLAPFENRSLTLKQINEAANAIVDLYQRKGRIAQAVVPPQDIKNGLVEIKITEGRVGAIIIEPAFKEDPPRLSNRVVKNFISYFNPEGGLLDFDGLERSVTLLNEIPKVHAEVSLEPGKEQSETNIMMKVDELSKISGRVDVTNYGSASTGYAQAITNISLNDLTGFADNGSIDIIKSLGSLYAQARFFIPGNFDGLRIGVGGATMGYDTLFSFSSDHSKGRANTKGFYATYALERSERSNKTINFNLENRAYINSTNGLEGSKYNINSANFNMQGNRFISDGILTWSFSGVAGNLIMDNASQRSYDDVTARTLGGYGKVSIYGLLNKPLPIKQTNLLLTVNGQLASKNLDPAEQFYLGGVYGVRAYPTSQGSGSQGGVISAEISHTFDNNIELGAFLDAGLIQQYKHLYGIKAWKLDTNAGNFYALYAAGLDAKYTYKKKAELSGVIAVPLNDNPKYNNSGEQLNIDNHDRNVQFWLKGTFFF